MAPERIEHGISSPASDLYSLGVCAFRCLTGRLPFVADTPEALTDVVSHGSTPDTRRLLDGAPAPLARIVSTLMAPNPAHRYPSARDLAQVVTESLETSDVELSVGTRDLDSSTVALDPRRSSTHRR